MSRPVIPLLLLLFLALTACSPLPQDANMTTGEMASLDSLPAAYGELVSATFAPQGSGATGWRELWFQNEETGQVTYVPVRLPDWKYFPKMVRTFDRPGWRTTAEVTP